MDDYTGVPFVKVYIAVTPEFGIGHTNDLPWPPNRRDMLSMVRATSYIDPKVKAERPGVQNVVLVGRKTYESIPKEHFPFKNRISVVISRTL